MANNDILGEINGQADSHTSINETNLHTNELHRYASYNYLFTLSAISESSLKNAEKIVGEAPSNIIARSAGIGQSDENEDRQDSEETPGLTTGENVRMKQSQSILAQQRDIYFESVDIDTVHSFNPERRSAAIGNIKIKLNEPTGVTLLEKLKAASWNCGYKDHVDAPYLLSLEFKGFDELGNRQAVDNLAGKKWIPIKIVKMHIKVNSAGATYDIDAIPYNEAGFLNRYNYLRTTINHEGKTTMERFLNTFETHLNKQTADEATAGLFTVGMEDTYKLAIHKDFSDEVLQALQKKHVGDRNLQSDDIVMPDDQLNQDIEALNKAQEADARAGTSNPGDSILKILEDAMLSLRPVQNVVKNWMEMTADRIRTAEDNKTMVISSNTFANLEDSEYYVNWFIIKSTVETNTGAFDKKTMQHPKTITYYIEPYKIHIFRLATTGVTLGGAKTVLVKKKYDYIFTGRNYDILDLDINYKVAYYQSKLRPKNANTSKQLDASAQYFMNQFGEATDIDDGGLLDIRSAPAGITNSGAGIFTDEAMHDTGAFMDALANPQADMVKVDLKIIGDPAWIGVSQFFNLNLLKKTTQKPVTPYDEATEGAPTQSDQMKKVLNAVGASWNSKYQCFNFDTHDPIVRLNFIMPGDLNEEAGTYELSGNKSATFSGLYQVTKVSSSFNNGAFTQTLHMIRFKNQSPGPATKRRLDTFVLSPDNKVVSLTRPYNELTNEEKKIVSDYIKKDNDLYVNRSGSTGGADTF